MYLPVKARPDDTNKVANFKKTLGRMETHSLQRIKECGQGDTSRLKTNGEVTKMFLVEFYRDLLMTREDGVDPETGDTVQSVLNKMLIR